MKYIFYNAYNIICQSRPARGAWVEIRRAHLLRSKSGRAPQGARGLKSDMDDWTDEQYLVAPRKGRVG